MHASVVRKCLHAYTYTFARVSVCMHTINYKYARPSHPHRVVFRWAGDVASRTEVVGRLQRVHPRLQRVDGDEGTHRPPPAGVRVLRLREPVQLAHDALVQRVPRHQPEGYTVSSAYTYQPTEAQSYCRCRQQHRFAKHDARVFYRRLSVSDHSVDNGILVRRIDSQIDLVFVLIRL